MRKAGKERLKERKQAGKKAVTVLQKLKEQEKSSRRMRQKISTITNITFGKG